MAEDKDNKNEFEKDFIKEADDETKINDNLSGLAEETILETNKGFLKDINKTANDEKDHIAEANESLISMDSAPFDQMLKIMSETLASIDAKMDAENSQLQKLDQLSEIKDQLNRLENISEGTTTTKITLEPEVIAEVENETEENVSVNNIGHNQQKIFKLLEKIQTLEDKILTIESQSNNSKERFEKIESVVKRFEDLEGEIKVENDEEEKPSLFKNIFMKKKQTKPYKKEIIIDEPEIQLTAVERIIPKDTASIIDEAEDSLKLTKDTMINENYDEELSIGDEKPKSNNLSYGLGMLLLLTMVIAILFFFNKFQIIDLNFSKVMNSIFSLIDSFIK